ncbi:hypothetical protein [Thermoflavimicrobium daqui]|uniref:Uncharacterized protein n=1 Tax=Thermoflavimicrobium daqui TaxID=2137476 RepID=A0A364K5M8_9BACL|nr:hypothetical protein [Thermoflavimicrobium daqui]RAL25604.1 hypothetical protein DL897_05870 [Thermoflavimicrobium daqui]
MLIQQGLSELKLIKKRMDKIQSELAEYSAWSSKKKHPWGIKGANQEYSVKHAEKEVQAKIQAYHDLANRFFRIKTAIDRTNLETKITVAGRTFTLHEALIYKNHLIEMNQNLVFACDQAIRRAEAEVERFNSRKEKDLVDSADLLYLFPKQEIEKVNDFNIEFMEKVDAALQIANATTEISGLEE